MLYAEDYINNFDSLIIKKVAYECESMGVDINNEYEFGMLLSFAENADIETFRKSLEKYRKIRKLSLDNINRAFDPVNFNSQRVDDCST